MAGPEATLAYAASLSGVAHVIRLRKEAGLLRLLAALSDGLPSEEALPVATALSYPEFQQSWQQYLQRVCARNRSPRPDEPTDAMLLGASLDSQDFQRLLSRYHSTVRRRPSSKPHTTR